MAKATKEIDKYVSTSGEFWEYLDEDFLKTSKDRREETIRKALNNFGKGEIDAQIECVSKCFEELWVNFSSRHIAKVLQSFPKVEKAFYGLELEEETGARYRDHFLHMFNTFMLGAALISQIISKVANTKLDEYVERIFKMTGEDKINGFPWPKRAYVAKQRLLFLWTLISTFHDVGIPVEHAPDLRGNLNEYFSHFGSQISELIWAVQPATLIRINHYFNLLSQLWHPNKGIILEEGLYKRYMPYNPYINGLLYHLLNKRDHAIFGAVCLLSSIESCFMGKREDEYNLKSQGDFKKYIDKIFEHDIARAGLAIALHNLNPKEGEAHNIFPIKFGKSPLLFLLILCDELQEYIRPEGISIRPITKLKKLPKLEVEVVTNNDQIDINVEVKLCYPKEINKEKEVILKQAETYYRPYRGLSITDADFQSLDTFLAWYWRQTTDRIKKKLSFQRENNVRIKFKLSVNKEEETGTVEEIHHFRK